MSQSVPQSFQTKYHNNVEMTLQQHKSKLLNAVTVTDEAGADKIKIKDLIGTAMPAEADERHGDTKFANTPHDGIWLSKPPELYYSELADRADNLATALDLEGMYVMEGAAVVERARDRRILEGIYGSMISGREGTVVTPFPASQTIAATVGGSSGAQRMNVAKLRAANKLLAKGYVDVTEQKFMVLAAEQSDDLLSEVPATSSDFVAAFGGKVDGNGFVTSLLGWNFIHLELANKALGPVADLSVDANGNRKNPFWVKSGIRANFWERLHTRVVDESMKNFSKHIRAGTTIAATRTQAAKVGIILNRET